MYSLDLYTDRPSWDNTWMQVAKTVAQRSLCTAMRVGAVIVDSGNRIMATGYNGPPAGFPNHYCPREHSKDHRKDFSDCIANHAEANALLYSDRTLREGGTIYITAEPCHYCAKLIASSGLARVVVIPDQDRGALQIIRESGLKVDLYKGDI